MAIFFSLSFVKRLSKTFLNQLPENPNTVAIQIQGLPYIRISMKLSKKLKFKTNKTLKLSKARLPNVVVIQSVPLTETFTIFNFFYHRFRYSTYCAG